MCISMGTQSKSPIPISLFAERPMVEGALLIINQLDLVSWSIRVWKVIKKVLHWFYMMSFIIRQILARLKMII